MSASNQTASEQVAWWMMRNGYATGHGDTLHDLLVELVGQAREEGYRAGDMGVAMRKLEPHESASVMETK